MLKIESITITQIYFLTPLEKIPAIEPENQKTGMCLQCLSWLGQSQSGHEIKPKSQRKKKVKKKSVTAFS